jgi:hypothetical protein
MLILAAFALYVSLVHLVAGQKRVVVPLMADGIAAFPKSTLFVVWHMVSFMLVATAGMLVWLSAHPNPPLRWFLAAQLAFAAAIFIVRASSAHGAGFALPQWILLGPLALCIALPDHGAAITLLLLALLHVAWAVGMVFPSPSRELAPTYVIGWRAGAAMPSRGATVVVAIALVAMAYASLVGPRWSAFLVAAVLLGRGSFGFIEGRVRPSISKTPYKLLSRAFYSPLCLLLGAVIFARAW